MKKHHSLTYKNKNPKAKYRAMAQLIRVSVYFPALNNRFAEYYNHRAPNINILNDFEGNFAPFLGSKYNFLHNYQNRFTGLICRQTTPRLNIE